MPNNTPINQPTTPGQSISTEVIGDGSNMPRGKMVIGVLGTDGGDVSASNPMPVTASALPLPTGAALDATLTGGTAKAQPVVAGSPVAAANPMPVDPTAVDLNATWSDTLAGLSGVIKASAGTFIEADFANTGGTAGVTLYLQFFNSTTVPVDGTAPSLFFPIPLALGSKISLRAPRAFSTGLSWCASTTIATKTIATGTPFSGSVEFR